jgi:hypothetical protein
VRYGIAQATRGTFGEEVAQQMIDRFPDMELVAATIEALGQDAEPIGDQLAALDLPLLLQSTKVGSAVPTRALRTSSPHFRRPGR